MLGIGALFLLFVLLYSQRVASQSCETLGELLHHPTGWSSARGDFNMLHTNYMSLYLPTLQDYFHYSYPVDPLRSRRIIWILRKVLKMSFHPYLGRICAFPFLVGLWGEDSEKHEDLQVPLKSIKNKLLLTPPPSKVNYKHRHKRSSVDITSKCPQLCRSSNKTVFPRPTYF